MWYSKLKKNKLDYNRPIGYWNEKQHLIILLPQMYSPGDTNSMHPMHPWERDIIGFNWFDTTTGGYDSNVFYYTVEDALECRLGYEFFNYDFSS